MAAAHKCREANPLEKDSSLLNHCSLTQSPDAIKSQSDKICFR